MATIGDDVKTKKPDPLIYVTAAKVIQEKHRCNLHRCVVSFTVFINFFKKNYICYWHSGTRCASKELLGSGG